MANKKVEAALKIAGSIDGLADEVRKLREELQGGGAAAGDGDEGASVIEPASDEDAKDDD